MTGEQLSIYGAMLSNLAQLEGMRAHNMQRAACGDAMAYDESSFFAIAAEFDRLAVSAANTRDN